MAKSLRKSTGQPGQLTLTVKDAIVLAYSNPAFMENLLAEPENWAEQFSLPPEAVKVLRTLDPAEVRRMGAMVRDPISFAESTEIIARSVAPVEVSAAAGAGHPAALY
jgi:hypothetical protein